MGVLRVTKKSGFPDVALVVVHLHVHRLLFTRGRGALLIHAKQLRHSALGVRQNRPKKHVVPRQLLRAHLVVGLPSAVFPLCVILRELAEVGEHCGGGSYDFSADARDVQIRFEKLKLTARDDQVFVVIAATTFSILLAPVAGALGRPGRWDIAVPLLPSARLALCVLIGENVRLSYGGRPKSCVRSTR